MLYMILQLMQMSSSWELMSYIILLFLLWALVRFIATCLTAALKYFDDRPVKVDPFVHNVQYAVSYWTERGGRPYQEDRHHMMRANAAQQGTDNSIDRSGDSSLYGVFDGHGGHRASQYCKDELLSCIANDTDFVNNPTKAIYRSFYKVDSSFSAKAKLQMLTDGTTAIVAIIRDGMVYVGNAGDSRAIIVKKGGRVKEMSIDHRPDRTDEELRIRKLGGTVVHWGRWRVEGILAVSRSIGDVTLQPFITCEPEIMEKAIEADDQYLVLASDGLWDVMENNEVGRLVNSCSKDFINIGKRLCTEALIMGSSDNITVLVIDLQQRIGRNSLNESSANKKSK